MLELWRPATGMRAGQVPTDGDALIARKLANAREAQPAVLKMQIEPAPMPELAP